MLSRPHSGPLAILTLAALAFGGQHARAAEPPPAMQVIKFVVEDDHTKVSGTKGLQAGWTRIEATAVSGSHDVRLFQDLPSGPDEPSNVLSLGGFYVKKRHPVTLLVKLPEGEIEAFDKSVVDDGGDLATLHVGPALSPAPAAPSKPKLRIAENGDYGIKAPSKLPAKGTIRYSNKSERDEELVLRRLAKGKDLAAVRKFLTAKGSPNSPFVETDEDFPYDIAGSERLAGHHYVQTTYNLPPGQYVLYDAAATKSNQAKSARMVRVG
jgi:hypothetical protein